MYWRALLRSHLRNGCRKYPLVALGGSIRAPAARSARLARRGRRAGTPAAGLHSVLCYCAGPGAAIASVDADADRNLDLSLEPADHAGDNPPGRNNVAGAQSTLL